jgi:hypothetical protein
MVGQTGLDNYSGQAVYNLLNTETILFSGFPFEKIQL